MTAAPVELDHYRAAFEAAEAERAGAGPAFLGERRRAGFERFQALGFPDTKQEAWRFTSLAALATTPFETAADPELAALPREALSGLGFGGAFAGRELVFVNGRLAAPLSSLEGLEGVEVASLKDALVEQPERLEPVLAKLADDPVHPFPALNTALFEDGALVRVPPGFVLREPLHLLFLSSSAGRPAIHAHPRVLVLAGRDSQATLVESHGGADGEVYLSNAVTEVLLEPGARLDHLRLQRESEAAFHLGSVAVRQERDSRYLSLALNVGAGLSRLDLNVLLAEPGGECTLDGLFMLHAAQHGDTHTLIDHASPHCASRELYKGILDGRARGVFHGKVRVGEGAQKTDAMQANRNLLLSSRALVNTTPALEIRADDVKCKHGSTTGQLDEGALFYLRTRGLDEPAARSLLTWAFASEVLGRVPVAAVREGLEALLRPRLPGLDQVKEAVA